MQVTLKIEEVHVVEVEYTEGMTEAEIVEKATTVEEFGNSNLVQRKVIGHAVQFTEDMVLSLIMTGELKTCMTERDGGLELTFRLNDRLFDSVELVQGVSLANMVTVITDNLNQQNAF